LWTGTLTMFRSRAGRSAFRSPKLEANEKTIEPKKTKERPS
jgi:hypothetical protein